VLRVINLPQVTREYYPRLSFVNILSMIKTNSPLSKASLTLLYPGTVILFSLGVLIGWSQDINELKRLIPDGVSMNPLTAILFFCCSIVILLNFMLRKQTHLANILSGVVFVVGTLKLFSYFGNYEFGIDQLLFTDELEFEKLNGGANVIAPNTAFNFSMLGLALLTYRRRGKLHLLSDSLSIIVIFSSFISLIGYIYNAKELYGLSNYLPMAVPTAICFMLVSIALVLNRKGSFILKTLTDQYSGSRMVRYLLPMAIILPVVLGLLRLYAQQIEFFTSNLGTALFAALNIFLFIFLILKSAATINKSDASLHLEIEERKRAEEKLLKSETIVREFNKELEKKVEERTIQMKRNSRLFRSLIENSFDAISVLDANGRILFSSGAVEKLTGYQPEELLKTRALAFIHPEDIKEVIELFKQVMTRPGVAFSTTLRLAHKNGEYRWAEGTIINLLEDENVKAVVTNFHDITEKKKAEEIKSLLEKKLTQEKINRQIQITQAAIDGQEKEKKEIGMELHDNINQILAATKLYLDMADSNHESQAEIIKRSKESVTQAIQEIRKLSKSMVPPAVGASGIITSIREFAEVINQSSGLHIDLILPTEIMQTLDEQEQLALYRIIQEQLNNIVKHAGAKNAVISLYKKSDTAVLTIKDDGKGFNVTANRSGIGLSNIQSRVEMLLGEFNIQSAPGKGCEMIIQLPCAA